MSYRERLGRPPDFRVRYRWLDDGQRPFQHMRCDFAYEGDDVERDGVHVISPEFEEADGRPLDESGPVPPSGTAAMWILNTELGARVHRDRVSPGLRGYLMAGAQRIARGQILEVIGLVGESSPT